MSNASSGKTITNTRLILFYGVPKCCPPKHLFLVGLCSTFLQGYTEALSKKVRKKRTLLDCHGHVVSEKVLLIKQAPVCRGKIQSRCCVTSGTFSCVVPATGSWARA